ncbi:hypothetical protein [Asanoa iriomotensis]|uniref:Adhesin domain-containing protein n=1 Tax=Asanoa iriomotensis TaxID=234613 RepID=A0ABQ4CEL1_9ACTN|nr:hypothetical protein [Asanoa iriomotensis]GIF61212.1 hypothetical protein Air01nite_73070 [Asanoa iriomotensis]
MHQSAVRSSLWRSVVPLLALLLLAACTAPGPARLRPHWAAEPGRGAVSGHTVTGPRHGLDAATFTLESGVTAVTVRVADLGDELFRVRTPDGAGVAPRIDRRGADLRLTTQGTGMSGPAELDVTLHREVAWHLRLGGGSGDERIDLRGGVVTAVDFVAGAGRISLALPAPRGTVPVRMTGGADDFQVRLTGRAPVRVRIGGGAGSASVDGRAQNGVPGETVIEGSGWAAARDRYDVDLAAGVSRFFLDRE